MLQTMHLRRAFVALFAVPLFIGCVGPRPYMNGVVVTDGRDFGTWRWENDGVTAQCGVEGVDVTLRAQVANTRGLKQDATLKIDSEHVDVAFPWSHVVAKKADCSQLSTNLERRPEDRAPVSAEVRIECSFGGDNLSVNASVNCSPPPVASASGSS